MSNSKYILWKDLNCIYFIYQDYEHNTIFWSFYPLIWEGLNTFFIMCLRAFQFFGLTHQDGEISKLGHSTLHINRQMLRKTNKFECSIIFCKHYLLIIVVCWLVCYWDSRFIMLILIRTSNTAYHLEILRRVT